MYLGFGRMIACGGAWAVAATLPDETVDVIAGGHEWPTWLTLWGKFLESRCL